MQISMTFSNIAAMFGVMVVGALIPSVSVLAVSARSAASGFIHGVFTALGIAIGDIIFILIAIFGLSVLAERMGSLFVLIKYLGGAYLIWLGVALWRAKSQAVETEGIIESSLLASFLAGLLITLVDQKAILFYLGFLPAFLDLSAMSYFDTGIIIVMAVVAVSTKLVYAFMADRASQLFKNTSAIKKINIAAGSVMIVIGVFILVKA